MVGQILLAHNSDDLIDRPATDQKLSMWASADSAQDLLPMTVQVHPLYMRPRGHDRSDRAVGQVENALNHVALDGVDHPQSRALRHEVVNIILGQGAFELWAHTQ